MIALSLITFVKGTQKILIFFHPSIWNIAKIDLISFKLYNRSSVANLFNL